MKIVIAFLIVALVYLLYLTITPSSDIPYSNISSVDITDTCVEDYMGGCN